MPKKRKIHKKRQSKRITKKERLRRELKFFLRLREDYRREKQRLQYHIKKLESQKYIALWRPEGRPLAFIGQRDPISYELFEEFQGKIIKVGLVAEWAFTEGRPLKVKRSSFILKVPETLRDFVLEWNDEVRHFIRYPRREAGKIIEEEGLSPFPPETVVSFSSVETETEIPPEIKRQIRSLKIQSRNISSDITSLTIIIREIWNSL